MTDDNVEDYMKKESQSFFDSENGIITKTSTFLASSFWVFFLFSTALVILLLGGLIATMVLSRAKYKRQTVIMQRLFDQPIISHSFFNDNSGRDTSNFRYILNAAYLPMRNANGDITDGLLMGVQDIQREQPTDNYDTAPGLIVVATRKNNGTGDSWEDFRFTQMTNADIVVRPGQHPLSEQGVEGPRVYYLSDTKTYYMFYTVVNLPATERNDVRHLALKTLSPRDDGSYDFVNGWEYKGLILGQLRDRKSGVLLRHSPTQTYLFHSDRRNIKIAVSTDENLATFEEMTSLDNVLIKPRNREDPDSATNFDSLLVEPAGEPMRLQNGNWLMLYNSAREVSASEARVPRPNWNRQYNVGYLILDKDDPLKIVERSSMPLLTPTLPWEICSFDTRNYDNTAPILGLQPNSVYVSGWKRVADGKDEFHVYYTGCGTNVGVAKLTLGEML